MDLVDPDEIMYFFSAEVWLTGSDSQLLFPFPTFTVEAGKAKNAVWPYALNM